MMISLVSSPDSAPPSMAQQMDGAGEANLTIAKKNAMLIKLCQVSCAGPADNLMSNQERRRLEEARRKAEALAVKPAKPGKKNKMEKKKTNLEIFKEELKAIQEERDKRAGLKPGGPSMAPGGNSMMSLENIPGSG